jgi:hypothetical protein
MLTIELPDLTTPPPAWTARAVAELARRANVGGDVADRGAWLVAADDEATLEVFQASHSLRYMRRGERGEPRREGVIDEARAREAADAWVHAFGPDGAQYAVHSVAEAEVLVSRGRDRAPERFVTDLQVNFRFDIGGLPLIGPGAKMQVSVGHEGEVRGAYRFWREHRPMKEARIAPAEQACEHFRRHPMFARLKDGAAKAHVHSLRLGYFAEPPTEAQHVLLPTYEFRGVLATELHPHYEFVTYLPAATPDHAAIKETLRPVRRPDVVAI